MPPTLLGGVYRLFDATPVEPPVGADDGVPDVDPPDFEPADVVEFVDVEVLLGETTAVDGTALLLVVPAGARLMRPELDQVGAPTSVATPVGVDVTPDAVGAAPNELDFPSAPQAARPRMRAPETTIRMCERAMKAKLVIDHYPG